MDMPITQNPHLKNGIALSGLLHNLQKRPPEWAGAILDDYEVERLAAIEHQAGNVKAETLSGLRALGNTLAIASASGELSSNDVSGCGWLISNLAELVQICDHFESNAQHVREHGPILKVAGSQPSSDGQGS